MLDPRDPPEAPLFDARDAALYGPNGGTYRPADLSGLVLTTSPDDQVMAPSGEWMKRSEFERRRAAAILAADDAFHAQAGKLE